MLDSDFSEYPDLSALMGCYLHEHYAVSGPSGLWQHAVDRFIEAEPAGVREGATADLDRLIASGHDDAELPSCRAAERARGDGLWPVAGKGEPKLREWLAAIRDRLRSAEPSSCSAADPRQDARDALSRIAAQSQNNTFPKRGGGVKVYRLESNSEQLGWLTTVRELDFNVLADLQGDVLGGLWVPLQVEWISDDLMKGLPKSDFPTLGTTPTFSQRAVDRLLDLLAYNGELLPLSMPDERFYAYNVTRTVDAFDEDRAEVVRFSSGRIMEVVRYEFRPEHFQGAPVSAFRRSGAKCS